MTYEGEHDRARAAREEDRRHQHVNRQPGAARGERHEQRRHDAMPRVRQDACGRNGRHVAPEADDEREKGPPGEPDGTHESVGHDRRASQVAAVLQEGEQREHDGHQRHERQEHPDPGDETVDNEAADPRVLESDDCQYGDGDGRHGSGEQPVECILERSGNGGRELEDRPHREQEDQRSGDRRKGHPVESVRPAHAGRGVAVNGRLDGRVDPGEALIGCQERVGSRRRRQGRRHGAGQGGVQCSDECGAPTSMSGIDHDDRSADHPREG